MPEVISINVGQAGVQISNAAWELFCMEHGIEANGLLKESLQDNDSVSFHTFFQEVPPGQYVPRAISIDLEPTVLDEVRTGAYRNLWHPDQLISGSEDAANNYARGHFTLGKLLIDSTIDRVRKAVDMCDMLQGFFIINSIGGGTGSGFSALILERIGVEYTKRSKFQVVTVPCTQLANAIVEPYNSLLSINASTEHSEICNLTDNEAVYQICITTLDIFHPTFNNLNRVLAQVFSSLTVSLRYESSLNADFDQISTNLVPYPRIHYPVCNHSPILSVRRAEHEQMSTQELTRTVFEEHSQLASIKMCDGRYMACCLQYRGNVTPKEVNNAIFEIKRRTDVKFVEWCPTGFKIGLNCQPPTAVPNSDLAQSIRSLTMLSNTTAVSQIWATISRKFDILFSKRSFVHWYVGEGMEEGEFNEARDDMNSLIQDYEEIAASEGEIVEEKRHQDEVTDTKKSLKSNKSIKSAKSVRSEKSVKSVRSEKSVKSNRSLKSERSEKSEKSEKSKKGGKSQKSETSGLENIDMIEEISDADDIEETEESAAY